MEQMRRILVSNNFITKTNYFKLDNKQEYLNSDSRLLTVFSPLGEIHCSKDFILILTFVQYVISLYAECISPTLPQNRKSKSEVVIYFFLTNAWKYFFVMKKCKSTTQKHNECHKICSKKGFGFADEQLPIKLLQGNINVNLVGINECFHHLVRHGTGHSF